MATLNEVVALIERFLNYEIPANQFDRAYMNLLTERDAIFSNGIDEILDRLFFQAEAFTDLPMGPKDNPDDCINEDQFRESAVKTLQELRALMNA